jgi:hypothetical protein
MGGPLYFSQRPKDAKNQKPGMGWIRSGEVGPCGRVVASPEGIASGTVRCGDGTASSNRAGSRETTATDEGRKSQT